jgi:hypothetical protein
MKASQMSPTIPILGRKRAAGLPGWFPRNSSMSCFIKGGSSSIASEVITQGNVCGQLLGLGETAKGISLIMR